MRRNVTALQILRASRDLLVRDGWRQSQYGPYGVKHGAPRCALGAVFAVLNEHSPLDESEVRRVWDALNDALPVICGWGWHLGSSSVYGRIAQWNDTEGRTENDVYELYSRAITRLI